MGECYSYNYCMFWHMTVKRHTNELPVGTIQNIRCNSDPAFISSMIDTFVWIVWRVWLVSMTLRFLAFILCKRSCASLKRKFRRSQTKLSWFWWNTFTNKFSNVHYCRFLYEYCQMSLTVEYMETLDKM